VESAGRASTRAQQTDSTRVRVLARPPSQAFAALFLRGQAPAERALALGCCLCCDAWSFGLPLAEAAGGAPGLRAAALLALPAALGCALASPAALALGRLAGAGAGAGQGEERSAGSRRHLDGGLYDGDWFAGAKDGLGVYLYARRDRILTRAAVCLRSRAARAHAQRRTL